TRVYPREEPGAGNPPARICEGESQMAELLDHHPFDPFVLSDFLLGELLPGRGMLGGP
ncbi:hypothetical protein SAMN05216338_10091, partial [Bradyrhizobium sp. Rc2d]